MELLYHMVVRIFIATGISGSLLVPVHAQPAKPNIAELEAKVAAARSDTARASALVLLAVSLWDKDPPRSLAYSQEALGIATRAGDLTLQGKALNSMGVVYGFVGSYEIAAEHFFKALQAREAAGDTAGTASTLSNIGVLYMRQKMYREALSKYIYADKILKSTDKIRNKIITWINIAKIYNDLLMPDSALFYTHKIRWVCDSTQVPMTTYSIYHVEAQAFYLKGLYAESLSAYQLLESRFDSISMPDQNITLSGMADVYIKLGQPERAVQYAHKMVGNAAGSQSMYERMLACTQLAKILKAAARFEEALSYAECAKTLEDSLDSEQATSRLQLLQAHYELAARQQENARLQQANRQQYLLIVGALVVMAVGLVLLGVLYRVNRQRRQALYAISLINRSLEHIVAERTRELTRRNEQLVSYAYLNSHEVRGPLARLMGLVYLLRQGWWSRSQEELVDLIEVSASELDTVIREINKRLDAEGAPPMGKNE